jgi:DNA-binding response OmpR family regulator
MTAPRVRPILVVEDDPTISEMLRVLLEDDGFRITTALSGRQAIELARTDPPELITLDLQLPDIDGYRILDQLHGQAHLQDVPVVIVSGRTYKVRPQDHVVAVLAKPLDASALDQIVRRTLGNSRQ